MVPPCGYGSLRFGWSFPRLRIACRSPVRLPKRAVGSSPGVSSIAKKEKAKKRDQAIAPNGEPDLRKLDRLQLLQLLRDAMEENDSLNQQLDEANAQLSQAQSELDGYRREHAVTINTMAANEQLRIRLAEANQRLEERRIELDDSESLAEAAMRLSGMFAAAQRAIDLYGYNVRINKEEAVAASNGSAEPPATMQRSRHARTWTVEVSPAGADQPRRRATHAAPSADATDEDDVQAFAAEEISAAEPVAEAPEPQPNPAGAPEPAPEQPDPADPVAEQPDPADPAAEQLDPAVPVSEQPDPADPAPEQPDSADPAPEQPDSCQEGEDSQPEAKSAGLEKPAEGSEPASATDAAEADTPKDAVLAGGQGVSEAGNKPVDAPVPDAPAPEPVPDAPAPELAPTSENISGGGC